MLSNDILRSLRYTLKANNNDMVRILALADMELSLIHISEPTRRS